MIQDKMDNNFGVIPPVKGSRRFDNRWKYSKNTLWCFAKYTGKINDCKDCRDKVECGKAKFRRR